MTGQTVKWAQDRTYVSVRLRDDTLLYPITISAALLVRMMKWVNLGSRERVSEGRELIVRLSQAGRCPYVFSNGRGPDNDYCVIWSFELHTSYVPQ